MYLAVHASIINSRHKVSLGHSTSVSILTRAGGNDSCKLQATVFLTVERETDGMCEEHLVLEKGCPRAPSTITSRREF